MYDKLVIGGGTSISQYKTSIDSDYTIHIKEILFRKNERDQINKDTLLCQVLIDKYKITLNGNFLKVNEVTTQEIYIFDQSGQLKPR
jgi:hypothetical protein